MLGCLRGLEYFSIINSCFSLDYAGSAAEGINDIKEMYRSSLT